MPQTGRTFVCGPCENCGRRGKFDVAGKPPWLCATCRKGQLTPIQYDCIAREARCFGCLHMELVESLRPGECHVKETLMVRGALGGDDARTTV